MPKRVPSQMVLHDVEQHRHEPAERLVVSRRHRIALDRVEEPQRRVGGVIEPLALAVREHVRDEAVAHVVSEGAQDITRLAVPVRRQRQPFEADHRVAAPVREPVVARDHRPHVVARRARARAVPRRVPPAGR